MMFMVYLVSLSKKMSLTRTLMLIGLIISLYGILTGRYIFILLLLPFGWNLFKGNDKKK
ncbi:hypothetical protein P278_08980 [Zhouia amylolytica AD3]|uniref:Uncharacterized protein n=1 Tax=Zhouia amylolytica AD3 TaxID=1286632 RepID=W2UQG6_9FLAO|nr:hypothetical protein P278_08980 [Zhouia amylolytica AD3]